MAIRRLLILESVLPRSHPANFLEPPLPFSLPFFTKPSANGLDFDHLPPVEGRRFNRFWCSFGSGVPQTPTGEVRLLLYSLHVPVFPLFHLGSRSEPLLYANLNIFTNRLLLCFRNLRLHFRPSDRDLDATPPPFPPPRPPLLLSKLKLICPDNSGCDPLSLRNFPSSISS